MHGHIVDGARRELKEPVGLAYPDGKILKIQLSQADTRLPYGDDHDGVPQYTELSTGIKAVDPVTGDERWLFVADQRLKKIIVGYTDPPVNSQHYKWKFKPSATIIRLSEFGKIASTSEIDKVLVGLKFISTALSKWAPQARTTGPIS